MNSEISSPESIFQWKLDLMQLDNLDKSNNDINPCIKIN